MKEQAEIVKQLFSSDNALCKSCSIETSQSTERDSLHESLRITTTTTSNATSREREPSSAISEVSCFSVDFLAESNTASLDASYGIERDEGRIERLMTRLDDAADLALSTLSLSEPPLKLPAMQIKSSALGFLLLGPGLYQWIEQAVPKEFLDAFKAAPINDLQLIASQSKNSFEQATVWISPAPLPEYETTETGSLTVKKATLLSLVSLLLTENSAADHDFIRDFFRTYRYYSEPMDIARILALRYIETLVNSSDDTSSSMLQLRVLNCFKKWATDHPQDLNEEETVGFIKQFLDLFVKTNAKRAVFADSISDKLATFQLKKTSEKRISTRRESENVLYKRESVSWSLLSLNKKRHSMDSGSSGDLDSLYYIDPEDLAKQLSLIEENLFKSCQIHEFFCQKWSKKESNTSNLQAFIDWFNRVASATAFQVVKETKLKRRVSILKRLIYTAHLCLRFANYNSCFAIVAGLESCSVNRLKKTWKLLPKKYFEVWALLTQLVSSEHSYKAYRSSLDTLREKIGDIPLVPYLGVFMSDLVFSEDGNPTFVDSDKHNSLVSFSDQDKSCSIQICTLKTVNFVKFRMISKLLGVILTFQNAPKYTFASDSDTVKWINNCFIAKSERELYEMSKICESKKLN